MAVVQLDDRLQGNRLADLPGTEKLFYEDGERTQFEAVVLDVIERAEGYDVVLDGTMPSPNMYASVRQWSATA